MDPGTGSDQIEIGEARPDEAEALIDLHVASWRSAYADIVDREFLDEQAGAMFRKWRYEELPALEGHRTWVARAGRPVVAFADTGRCRDDDAGPADAELYTLHVQPGLRGGGIGSRVLSRLVEDLAARRYQRVTAWVLDGNAPARGFYEARGWRLDGRTLSERLGSAVLDEVRYSLDLA